MNNDNGFNGTEDDDFDKRIAGLPNEQRIAYDHVFRSGISPKDSGPFMDAVFKVKANRNLMEMLRKKDEELNSILRPPGHGDSGRTR